jgi:hypothetical protein
MGLKMGTLMAEILTKATIIAKSSKPADNPYSILQVGIPRTFAGAYRERGDGNRCPEQIGAKFKDAMTEAGPGHIYACYKVKQFLKKKIMFA